MRNLERFAPPGMKLNTWKGYSQAALAVSISFSLLTFLIRLVDALEELTRPGHEHMAAFREVVGFASFPFWLCAVSMVIFAISFYFYFYQDARSIYTMRRLKSMWELHRMCWTLPILSAVALVVCGLVLEGIYFLLYLIVTPADMLPAAGFRFWGR